MKKFGLNPEDLFFPILAVIIIIALVFYFLRGKESFQQGNIYDLAKKRWLAVEKGQQSVSSNEDSV